MHFYLKFQQFRNAHSSNFLKHFFISNQEEKPAQLILNFSWEFQLLMPFHFEAIGSTELYAWGVKVINGLNGPFFLLGFSGF